MPRPKVMTDVLRRLKREENEAGHEMGNAVNIVPTPGWAYSVQSKCRHCCRRIVVNGNHGGAQGHRYDGVRSCPAPPRDRYGRTLMEILSPPPPPPPSPPPPPPRTPQITVSQLAKILLDNGVTPEMLEQAGEALAPPAPTPPEHVRFLDL